MASTSAQVVHADGRVELADSAHAAIADSRFYNRDLAPVPISKRTWNTYNYAALWVGMAHCIPTYLLASGFIALGMAWWQAIGLVAIGNLIVLVPMLLNSHAGTRYGIPFPVLARAAYGVRDRTSQPSHVPWWPVGGSGSRVGSVVERSSSC